MNEKRFDSPEKTQIFASELAKNVEPGTVIALIGNLGAGKTTFAQGFAKGLGLNNHVISPTFKLVSEYIGNVSLYHIDCYRLDTSFDFLNIGGEEYLNPIDGITLIEWPERINDLWSDDWIYIYFKRIKDDANTRIIKIKGKLN
jgi:tRNA threonylcarbamoyladenosine biosynthesis protein TsaE